MNDKSKKQDKQIEEQKLPQNPPADSAFVATPAKEAVPPTVEETADQTPIEVPNAPTQHPGEEEVARESLRPEEFEKEKKAAKEEGSKPAQPVAKAVSQVPEEQIAQQTPQPKEKKTKETQAKAPKEEKPHPASTNPNAKWYIVHTYSGHENKVAKSLKQRVQSLGFEDRIFDIMVPTRNTIKVSQGKKESVREKIFPGYVLIKMILDDESWLTVRTTQGVTAFIGAGNKPTPISDKEVEAIQKFMAAEEPLYKTVFSVGEAVKITDGPFNDFLGTIDYIDESRGKLKVLVSIFGRETPVELDFLQVKKL